MPKDTPQRQSFLSRLGPGLITGAADDDPSGIGTHSQIGAQFGYGLSWTFLFSFPLMVAIQEVAAQIGRVTGAGIARNLRRHYPRPLLVLMVGLLLVANIVNLGADLAAMGAAVGLLIGGPLWLYTLLFGAFCVIVEIWLSYERYASVLKWATLSLFAYVAVVIVAHVPWGEALASLVVPRIEYTGAYATAVVAILGTTISPYLFFWQASQEIEEQKRHKAKPLCITPKDAGPELKRIRVDTLTGMAFSSIVSLAIVFALFSLGIIGTGLLAVPVLAGSAAYAVTEMFGIASSLDAKPTKARLFYGTIAVTTMLGVSLQYVGIDPARALYWAAVVNGVLAAPLMVMMMLIVRNPRAMGRLTLGPRATITGWFATLVMAGATIIFFATL